VTTGDGGSTAVVAHARPTLHSSGLVPFCLLLAGRLGPQHAHARRGVPPGLSGRDVFTINNTKAKLIDERSPPLAWVVSFSFHYYSPSSVPPTVMGLRG